MSLRPKVAPYRSMPHPMAAILRTEITPTPDDLPPSPTEEFDVLDASDSETDKECIVLFRLFPFQLRFYTSRYADGAYLTATKELPTSRKFRSLWFSVGAFAALVCLVGISMYLTHLLYRGLFHVSFLMSLRPKVAPYRSMPHPMAAILRTEVTPTPDDLPPSPTEEFDVLDASDSETGLVPIIPGVNLPWSHIPIFMIVLAAAAIIHELLYTRFATALFFSLFYHLFCMIIYLIQNCTFFHIQLGHSSAAKTYNVRVNGFGIFLLGLYPGAFTDIDPESLRRSHPRHRLEIFGGGIWHNLILAGIAYLMFLWTPYFLSPFFAQGNGVTVTGVDSRSGLYGVGGLSEGNVVLSIDDCAIRKQEDWRKCVRHLEKEKHGQCVPRSAVEASLATKVGRLVCLSLLCLRAE
ncbi:unnamed protein product [Cylicostephanus goldi]|uniref:Membrane-bound transcription factor site-2 protease n=1 Tax=Cylicostephanus goldi TaxID=71465 RepID=A0A3P7MIB6_CYLGO|nr:unnamed protein product [Cylicostephanus goldi]